MLQLPKSKATFDIIYKKKLFSNDYNFDLDFISLEAQKLLTFVPFR